MKIPLDEREQTIISRGDSIPTLGNLTLLNLSVNREAQHKSFIVKKELLLANTNLRLNVPLLGMETWDEETIKKRGELLADIALRVWPGIKAESGKGGLLTRFPHTTPLAGPHGADHHDGA